MKKEDVSIKIRMDLTLTDVLDYIKGRDEQLTGNRFFAPRFPKLMGEVDHILDLRDEEKTEENQVKVMAEYVITNNLVNPVISFLIMEKICEDMIESMRMDIFKKIERTPLYEINKDFDKIYEREFPDLLKRMNKGGEVEK